MQTQSAEWAVLSACNTAAGDGENAGALSGFPPAPHGYPGVR